MVFNLAKNFVSEKYEEFLNRIKAGSEDYSDLKVLHHYTSGLKAFYT